MKQKERIVRALEQFSTAMLAALGYLPAAGLVLAAGAPLASAGLGSVAPVLPLGAFGPGGQPGLRRDDGHHPESQRGVLRGHRGLSGPEGKAAGRHHRPAVHISCS